MKLYYHKTDGGAEYLCTEKVKGTKDEGDMRFTAVRLDGGAVLENPYAAAPEMLTMLKDVVFLERTGMSKKTVKLRIELCKDVIAKAGLSLT